MHEEGRQYNTPQLQNRNRRNAEYIRHGLKEDRDKRVEDMGAQAKQHAAYINVMNKTSPEIKATVNKPVYTKVSNKQAAEAMSGTSYSKLLKFK
jgi:hypothetical protein